MQIPYLPRFKHPTDIHSSDMIAIICYVAIFNPVREGFGREGFGRC